MLSVAQIILTPPNFLLELGGFLLY